MTPTGRPLRIQSTGTPPERPRERAHVINPVAMRGRSRSPIPARPLPRPAGLGRLYRSSSSGGAVRTGSEPAAKRTRARHHGDVYGLNAAYANPTNMVTRGNQLFMA